MNEKNHSISIKLISLFVAFIILFSHFMPTSDVTIYAGEKYEKSKDEKIIALTFDDGPSNNIDELLSLLDDYGAKVSFFFLGAKAEKNPELVKKVFDAGHLVGNHTYSHERLWAVKSNVFIDSINKTNDILQKITGVAPTFYRPPHGTIMDLAIKQISMICVNWSIDTVDWKYKNANDLANRLIKRAKDGSIVLMHDKIPSTLEGLKIALPILKSQGFSFVTVDEVLLQNRTSIKSGITYNSSKFRS